MWSSMTGFGRVCIDRDGWQWLVEIRSVNHKALEIRCHTTPKSLAWEHLIQKYLQSQLQRGRVEIYVRAEQLQQQTMPNNAELNRLRGQRLKWRLAFGEQPPLTMIARTQTPTIETPSDELLLAIVAQACTSFLNTRQAEGQQLQKVIEQHLEKIQNQLSQIQLLKQAEAPHQRERLLRALHELQHHPQTDGAMLTRLEQEMSFLLIKSDISEEIDRIKMHGQAASKLLEKASPVGRELDMLAQEFSREAHTISAKVNTSELKEAALLLRQEAEKLREQVQNIE